jgi:hypothetical protein
MAQIFRQRSNTIARVCLLAAVLLIGGTAWLLHAVYWSPYTTRVNVPQEQPVPFSHKHHVDGLGIDCRYCHASVENAAFAGMPATETCMTCHSQLWTAALDAGPRSSRLRFLQSQHPRSPGNQLRHLPRTGGSNAADAPGEHALHEMVSRLPS